MRWPRARTVGIVTLAILGTVVFCLVAIRTLAWLAWERQEFGPLDPRYFLFIRGTQFERVGIFAPEAGSLAYSARGRDGPGPPYAIATYRTKMLPDELIASFLAKCTSLGLQIKTRDKLFADGDRLTTCGGKDDDDHLLRFVVGGARPTHVTLSEEIDDGVYSRR